MTEIGVKREFSFEEFLVENKFTIVVLILGVILLGLGMLSFKFFRLSSSQPMVEIMGESNSEDEVQKQIVVEAAGEILKPGVYRLPVGSRAHDLLTAAGGLSASADREWVSKNINLAQKLQDGAKIYIPNKTQNANLNPPAGGQNQVSNSESAVDKININTASKTKLESLWGIGPATAQKIIEGRPYQNTEELLTKKIVKSNVWEAIKEKITTY